MEYRTVQVRNMDNTQSIKEKNQSISNMALKKNPKNSLDREN